MFQVISANHLTGAPLHLQCADESKNIVKVNTNNFNDDELKMSDSNILKKFKVYDDVYTIYRDTLDYYNYIVIEKVVF